MNQSAGALPRALFTSLPSAPPPALLSSLYTSQHADTHKHDRHDSLRVPVFSTQPISQDLTMHARSCVHT